MITIRSDKTAWFDVDDTLVEWHTATAASKETIELIFNDRKYYYYVIQENVEALKLHASRGHKIVVWSKGGYEWAESVVWALKLEGYVDVVCSKPEWIYDDKEAVEWMPKRKYGASEN